MALVFLAFIRAGSQNVNVLPPPVGKTVRISSPLRVDSTISLCDIVSFTSKISVLDLSAGNSLKESKPKNLLADCSSCNISFSVLKVMLLRRS